MAPWAILAPSTAWGPEVAARVAAKLGAGLIGDAVGLKLAGGDLVAAKPAFAGSLIADITCTSPVRLVTVRPGVLPSSREGASRSRRTRRSRVLVDPRTRIVTVERGTDDEVEVLARAETVIGVGSGIAPGEYDRLASLAALLGAELAATRRVTDNRWMPRARQIGVTGRSIGRAFTWRWG